MKEIAILGLILQIYFNFKIFYHAFTDHFNCINRCRALALPYKQLHTHGW